MVLITGNTDFFFMSIYILNVCIYTNVNHIGKKLNLNLRWMKEFQSLTTHFPVK